MSGNDQPVDHGFMSGDEVRRLAGRICADMHISKAQLADLWLGYTGKYGSQTIAAFVIGRRRATYSQAELLKAIDAGYRPEKWMPGE